MSESVDKTARSETGGTGGDLLAVVQHVRENPWLYVGGVVIVIIVALGVLGVRSAAHQSRVEAATALIEAINIDDPAERADALAEVAATGGPFTPEAVYLQAEAAYVANDLETAKAGFLRVRDEFPEFELAPFAIEGLGYVEEAQGNLEAAVEHYQNVRERYPDTYAARRQNFNIGRVHEARGDAEQAVRAYRTQAGEFSESIVAFRAREALQKFRASHPELFEDFSLSQPEPADPTEDFVEFELPEGLDQSGSAEDEPSADPAAENAASDQ